MKKLILLIISLTSTIYCSTSDALKYAYLGDWNLMHKSMLINDMEYHDTVLSLVYYYYNKGEHEEMYFWLDHLHKYLQTRCE